MDATSLKALVEEHCKGHASVPERCGHKDIAIQAAEYCSYLDPEKFTVQSFIGTQTYHTLSSMEKNLVSWLDSWSKLGVDLTTGIKTTDIRVEVFSSRVAFCWLTQQIIPAGQDPIEFTNVYTYRLPVGKEKGKWDTISVDQQNERILERFPNFFQQEGAKVDQGDVELS